MKTIAKTCIGILLSVSLFLPTLSGCEQEGPAERAGKAMDEATEEVKEDLGEAKENLEEAGEKVQDSIN